jgi:tRNA pseudouridine32 synthase / 23S rRNA pseudouridine746 synthase
MPHVLTIADPQKIIQIKRMNQPPSTVASNGFCKTCQTSHSLPIGNSRQYARELMNELETLKRVDDGSNPKFSTDYLWSNARGQMFGVLECKNSNGDIVVLKAFSCQYNGEWLTDGWAPPLFDVNEFHELTTPVYKQISDLGEKIQANPGQKDLIEQRAALSRNLMKKIHQLYSLTNFTGETKSLNDILGKQQGIPAGTGDCCAPKLLNHAARLGLTPLGLSEFYWGKESKSGARQHGVFYPACADKCQPILGFMLCGITKWNDGMPQPPIQKSSIPILHSDNDIVVVEKPSGLLSVPGRGPENQDCVVARIKKLFPGCPDHPEVHRLDMDTSGLMVFARTKEAHRELSRQFHDRETGKRYIALLDGELTDTEGTIELPFRLDVDNRPTQIYDPVHGKMGTTHWKTLSVENGKTRIEFTPITGRTHQLRIHSASEHGLGTPIIGDRLYGTGTAPGQLKLHAAVLGFTHPRTGERLQFTSEPTF